MGTKGDRAAKEPLAQKLYADGMSLTGISKQLDISDTTLRRWKEESRVPGEDIDGWDRARQQKRSMVQRFRDILDEQMNYLEELSPAERNSQLIDTMSKLGALVQRWEAASAQEGKSDIDRPAVFLENIEWLAKTLKDMDPEGLKVLAKNFDALILQYKAEHAKTS